MTYTTILKNEIYLVITTLISVGILSGCQYCSPLLAILLIAPLVRVWLNKLVCMQHIHFSNTVLNKYIACKPSAIDGL